MLPDEDPIPPNGSLFPLPPLAQRWRGLHGPAASNDHFLGSQSSVGQHSPARDNVQHVVDVMEDDTFSSAAVNFAASDHNPELLSLVAL